MIDRRSRNRLLGLASLMLFWAMGYGLILVLQGAALGWRIPAGLMAMALIPAAAVALCSMGRSPRRLVAAIMAMASWATILGVVGLLSVGLPLIGIAFLAYRLAHRYADGQAGRPTLTWARWAAAISAIAGIALATLLLST